MSAQVAETLVARYGDPFKKVLPFIIIAPFNTHSVTVPLHIYNNNSFDRKSDADFQKYVYVH